MYLLVIEMKMELPWSNSLKDKRRIKLSILDGLKRSFNLNSSEVGFHDNLKILNIGVSAVNGDIKVLENISFKIREFIEKNFDGEIIEFNQACVDWSWEK